MPARSITETKKSDDLTRHGPKGEAVPGPARLRLAAVGMEAEFRVVVDGREARPEDVFGDPRSFMGTDGMHRVGSSYSLPTGGAVYFDTGVIEVATPVIEIEPGCVARAGRSLWEAIGHVRSALDRWERRTGRSVRLTGFSTHFNVSFASPDGESPRAARTVQRFALLLAYVLPVPVMLLAANRTSSGIGVRPRGDRVEVTSDFTPSAALTIGAGVVATGIIRAMMEWPSYSLRELEREGVPVIEGFRPRPHPSRKGWRAARESFPEDPFASSPDDAIWNLTRGGEPVSLRHIAREIELRFRDDIAEISGPFTLPLVDRILSGEAPALLDLPERPAAYDDVGRLCLWDDLFPESVLRRSRYERVLVRAIAGVPLRIDGRRFRPIGLRGWAEVVFVRDDGTRHAFPLDFLLEHLDDWERQG